MTSDLKPFPTFVTNELGSVTDRARCETKRTRSTYDTLEPTPQDHASLGSTLHRSWDAARSQMPEFTLRRADTALVDDPTTAYIAYNDKYVIVYDFSQIGSFHR